MLLIGLTGGIGSGKSTVSARLAGHGAVVVDADAIVHELQQPGQPVLAAMVDRFGPGILEADGTLRRQAVAVEIERRISEQVDTDRVVILDVPLLVESGRDDMAGTIVVDVDPEIAIARLVEHRSFAEADARARVARQASREQRVAKADFLVDNSGTVAELEAQADAAWAWIQGLPRA